MLNPTFKIREEEKKSGYGRFSIEPLEPGFGHTLGVALRRVLLSSIEGAAVTSVKIEGVSHMFSTIKGLKEDMIELIFNIKTMHVLLEDGKREARIFLKKKGKGTITAQDIELTEGVEIVNKDHYLGSLSGERAKIEMEMIVEKGMGYTLAEERKITTVGIIPIDAIFSPIIKVSYRVEQTRVGRQTNFDKLILEIWANGTVDAAHALNQASKILVAFFLQVYEPKEEVGQEEVIGKPRISEEILKMTIDELDLPTRIYNSLRNAGIDTVGQLLGTPRKELVGFRNLGAKSLSIIEESLKQKRITPNS